MDKPFALFNQASQHIPPYAHRILHTNPTHTHKSHPYTQAPLPDGLQDVINTVQQRVNSYNTRIHEQRQREEAQRLGLPMPPTTRVDAHQHMDAHGAAAAGGGVAGGLASTSSTPLKKAPSAAAAARAAARAAEEESIRKQAQEIAAAAFAAGEAAKKKREEEEQAAQQQREEAWRARQAELAAQQQQLSVWASGLHGAGIVQQHDTTQQHIQQLDPTQQHMQQSPVVTQQHVGMSPMQQFDVLFNNALQQTQQLVLAGHLPASPQHQQQHVCMY